MILITRNNLKRVTSCPLAVISFWAPWCGPCKLMKPVMSRLERVFRSRIRFGRMNVSHHQDVAENYDVMSIPSLVIFEHGRAHEKVTGYYSAPDLAGFLNAKLKEI